MGKGRTRASKAAETKEEKKEEKKEEPKQEKTQQISKPKKYVKKSVDAIQRIQRSKHERIFLLSARRDENYWNFQVLGTKGSTYYVTASTTLSCTCFDFRIKKKPCKHIFFIVTQVAQNEEILNYIRSSSTNISKAAYGVLDKQLTERLKSRLEGTKKDATQIDLKDDTDCTICFTEMDKDNEDLEDCHQCKKFFHVMCLSAWKSHNPTCPLCRAEFKIGGTGALSQLKQITL